MAFVNKPSLTSIHVCIDKSMTDVCLLWTKGGMAGRVDTLLYTLSHLENDHDVTGSAQLI